MRRLPTTLIKVLVVNVFLPILLVASDCPNPSVRKWEGGKSWACSDDGTAWFITASGSGPSYSMAKVGKNKSGKQYAMAVAQVVAGGDDYGVASAHASHQYVVDITAKPGVNVEALTGEPTPIIPVRVQYSADVYHSARSGYFANQGKLIIDNNTVRSFTPVPGSSPRAAGYSQYSGTVEISRRYPVGLGIKVEATALTGVTQGFDGEDIDGYARVWVDPTVTIDPAWPYAGSFDVVVTDADTSEARLSHSTVPEHAVRVVDVGYDSQNDVFSMTFHGLPATPYVVKQSADLDFSAAQEVSPEVATVGVLAGNEVLTDSNGAATVQLDASGQNANFFRVESQ